MCSGMFGFYFDKWAIAYLTHDSFGGVDGWGVGCGDEGRAASSAAVEAGHRRQAGIDVCGRH